jgi:hypothetical protein
VPVTVAARSKAVTVFARSDAVVVSSNPTKGMDVWFVCLFCVCLVLCVVRGLATGRSPVQGVLLHVYKIKKLKSGQCSTKGCRAIIIIIIIKVLSVIFHLIKDGYAASLNQFI